MMILLTLTLTFCVVVGTLTYGIIQKGKDEISGKEKMRKALKVNLSIFVPVVTAALVMNIPSKIGRAHV